MFLFSLLMGIKKIHQVEYIILSSLQIGNITHFVISISYILDFNNSYWSPHQIRILLYGIYTITFHDNYVIILKFNINKPLYNFNYKQIIIQTYLNFIYVIQNILTRMQHATRKLVDSTMIFTGKKEGEDKKKKIPLLLCMCVFLRV